MVLSGGLGKGGATHWYLADIPMNQEYMPISKFCRPNTGIFPILIYWNLNFHETIFRSGAIGVDSVSKAGGIS